jgi:hypothetical protein
MWKEIVQKFGGEELDVEEKRKLSKQLKKTSKQLQRSYLFVHIYIGYMAF